MASSCFLIPMRISKARSHNISFLCDLQRVNCGVRRRPRTILYTLTCGTNILTAPDTEHLACLFPVSRRIPDMTRRTRLGRAWPSREWLFYFQSVLTPRYFEMFSSDV